MNKKAFIAILFVAMLAISAMTVVAVTYVAKWVDVYAPLSFTADPNQGSSGVGIGLFTDCGCTIPVANAVTNPATPPIGGRVAAAGAVSHDFGMVDSGNSYTWSIFVWNNNSKQVYITYLPTTFSYDNGQTYGSISVAVVGYGTPCQLSPVSMSLPEKDPTVLLNGFQLASTQVIKLDITLTIGSIMADQTYDIPFEIAGACVTVQA
jgi:hypothetical protein